MEAEVVSALTLNPIQSLSTKLFQALLKGFPPLGNLALWAALYLVGHTASVLHPNAIHGSVFDTKLARIHNRQPYLSDPTQINHR